jgi:rsbT co-antagonist protein RsbR
LEEFLASRTSHLPEILRAREDSILKQWLTLQSSNGVRRGVPADERRAVEESREFLNGFRSAAQTGNLTDIQGAEWSRVRDLLTRLSDSRAKAGFTPTETATFVFSLKEPLFISLREELAGNAEALANETWIATTLLDKLGLFTTEVAQRTRDEVISRQQQELLELSTPVVRLWENVLALPLIGTLDSARTQVVMQNLLQAIVDTRSDIAIIDITGVPTVDTLVAQHLLKTVAAARLMGADCIISGIRPQIAQTIIHLGVDLAEVSTKATLADAFALALRRTGLQITRVTQGNARS